MSKRNLKLYGVVGRAISCGTLVDQSTAELLEVDDLLDIGRECYEIRSMIEKDDMFMLNLCCVRKPDMNGSKNRIRIENLDHSRSQEVA